MLLLRPVAALLCLFAGLIVLRAEAWSVTATAAPQAPAKPSRGPKGFKYRPAYQTARTYQKVEPRRFTQAANGHVGVPELEQWLARQGPLGEVEQLKRHLVYRCLTWVPHAEALNRIPLTKYEFGLSYQGKLLPPSARQSVWLLGGQVVCIEEQALPRNLRRLAAAIPSVPERAALDLGRAHAQAALNRAFEGRVEPTVESRPGQPPRATLGVWLDPEGTGHYAWTFIVTTGKRTVPFVRRYWVGAEDRERLLGFEDLVHFAGRGTLTGAASLPAPPQPAPFPPATFLTAGIGAGIAPAPLPDNRLVAALPLAPMSTKGTVKATVWRSAPFQQADLEVPLRALDLTYSDGGTEKTTRTDDDGKYECAVAPGAAIVKLKLKGPFCEIVNEAGPAFEKTQMGMGAVDFDLRPQLEHELAQLSAYCWVNEAYAFVKPELDDAVLKTLKVKVYVNDETPGMARYDRRELTFARSATSLVNTLPNMAYRDVVMHEYGHAIDDACGGIQGSGYGEGFGDALALLYSAWIQVRGGKPLTSILGPEFDGKNRGPMRDAAASIQWADVKDLDDDAENSHEIGRVFAAFTWELLQRLLAKYGNQREEAVQVARRLIVRAALNNPGDIPSAVRYSFLLDTQFYADAGGASKHFAELLAAAKARGIPFPQKPADLTSPLVP